jgi:phosphoglycolate phosphatase-like HAD superfamily hydrolase
VALKLEMLMTELQSALKNIEPNHKHIVFVDSDGCAFDTMEIKHKECFIPMFIKHFDLQPVSRYARETAEFVNLHSKWRGANRFFSYAQTTLDFLRERPEVQARNCVIPQMQSLREWTQRETKLGTPALRKEVKMTGDLDLKVALDWTIAVNKAVREIVHNVPPFPLVQESLDKVSKWADIIVCSVTQDKELKREWEDHQFAQYVRFIAGQEVGNKAEIVETALHGGKYDKENAIMLGDAPGDKKAANDNGILYFPIKPNQEENSWECFYDEAAEKFRNGQYAGEYENRLIAEFEALLPEIPPWENS